MAYIQQVEPKDATGKVKDFYNKLIERDGRVRGIFKLNSLKPEVMFGLSNLYSTVMYGDSGLTRTEKEMVATVVSAINGCDY